MTCVAPNRPYLSTLLVSFLSRRLRSSRFFPASSLLTVIYTRAYRKEFCRLLINLSREDCSCTLGTRDLFFFSSATGCLVVGCRPTNLRSKVEVTKYSQVQIFGTTLVNNQLVRLRPGGILYPFMFDLIHLFQGFAQPH